MIRSPLSTQLLDAITRVQRRVRAQRAVAATLVWLPWIAATLATVTLLDRLRVIPADVLVWMTTVGTGALAVVVARQWWRSISPVGAAQRLDRHLGTADRLSAAVDFSQRDVVTPWMAAAMEDAHGRVPHGAARQAAPVVAGASAKGALWAVGAWIAMSFVSVPTGQAQGSALASLRVPTGFTLRAAHLDAAALEELTALRPTAERTGEEELDERVSEAVDDLNALIRGLRGDEVRTETAHQRLASLEARLKAFDQASGEDAPRELERAKKAGEGRRRRGREINPLLDAIAEARWKEAAEALEDMAKRAPGERRRLGRDLEGLAKRLESERARSRRKLKERRRRLRKKRETSGKLGRAERRRLRRTERSLERLQREEASAGETGRHLERLERELQRAAEDLLRRGASGEGASEALRRAAEALRRMSKSASSRSRMRWVESRAEAVREILRRAARRGDPEKKGKEEEGRERFLRLARGDGPPGGDKEGRGDGARSSATLLLPGGGATGRTVSSGGSGAPSAGSIGAEAGGGPGEGIGEGSDPTLRGASERLAVKTRDVQVQGDEAQGPSTRRVVASAARRGFATSSWRRVHQDYEGVVEERMERQDIPAGHRRYVRRYFELIRPR